MRNTDLVEFKALTSNEIDNATSTTRRLECRLEVKLSSVDCGVNDTDILDDCSTSGWGNATCSEGDTVAAVSCTFEIIEETATQEDVEMVSPSRRRSRPRQRGAQKDRKQVLL